jgi:hypothetical protein
MVWIKFTGAAMIAVDDGAKKAFFPEATNDVLSMMEQQLVES